MFFAMCIGQYMNSQLHPHPVCLVINSFSEKDECALGEDDCLDILAECTNTPPGSFTCTCNTGYSGTGHGQNSCTGNGSDVYREWSL